MPSITICYSRNQSVLVFKILRQQIIGKNMELLYGSLCYQFLGEREHIYEAKDEGNKPDQND